MVRLRLIVVLPVESYLSNKLNMNLKIISLGRRPILKIPLQLRPTNPPNLISGIRIKLLISLVTQVDPTQIRDLNYPTILLKITQESSTNVKR